MHKEKDVEQGQGQDNGKTETMTGVQIKAKLGTRLDWPLAWWRCMGLRFPTKYRLYTMLISQLWRC